MTDFTTNTKFLSSQTWGIWPKKSKFLSKLGSVPSVYFPGPSVAHWVCIRCDKSPSVVSCLSWLKICVSSNKKMKWNENIPTCLRRLLFWACFTRCLSRRPSESSSWSLPSLCCSVVLPVWWVWPPATVHRGVGRVTSRWANNRWSIGLGLLDWC